MSKIGVVLVVYNFNKTDLLNAMQRILAQADTICVVDNSSVDSSSVFSGMDRVVYKPLLQNKGIAEAQNIGIQYFIDNQYDYLVFSDQDSLIEEGTIQGLKATYLKLKQLGYNIGAVGPRAYNKETNMAYPHQCNKLGEMTLADGTPLTEVTYTMSSLSFQEVETFRKVGLMDGPLFIDSVECEWCWRAAHHHGLRFFVDENIHLNHMLGLGTKKILGKDRSITPPYRLRTQLRNYMWLLRRDYTPKAWLKYNGAKYLCKMFYYPIFAGDTKNYLKYICAGIKEGCKKYPAQKAKSMILLLAFLLSSVTAFCADVMPIIAYMGVPYDKSTDYNFKVLSECGFTVSLYDYQNLQQMQTAMTHAAKYGVKIIGHCPETHTRPQYAASVLKNNPAFYGYLICDEPSTDRLPELQREINLIKAVDNEHCFYVNLFPYYDESMLIRDIKTNTYWQYVNQAATLPTQQLSFDFYPVTTEGFRESWYNNIEMIRNKSISTGKPFWGFALCVPHIVYPQPTMGQLRLQVYTNLVYGAQAIQYFAYWTPAPDAKYDYHNGPITRDGKKTNTYYLVQKMNRELKKVAPLFYGATVTVVNHLGRIPFGTKELQTTPLNIRKLTISGEKGAIVSQFTKGTRKYMALVNKDYDNTLKLHIEKRNSTPMKVNSDLTLQAMVTDYTIPAGGMIIFRLN